MNKLKSQPPTRRRSRESNLRENPSDLEMQWRVKSGTGSRRSSSVLSMLPKTPPSTPSIRRLSISYDKDMHDTDGVRHGEDGTYGEERSADVASKASFKVSRFLDYYNEALRRRLERELLKPVSIPIVEDISEDSERSSDEDISDGEVGGKAAAYWKRALKKTQIINKMADGGPQQAARKVSVGTHTLSQIGKRKAVKKVQLLLRRLEVRKRFRKKTRIIIFCIRCVRQHGFK